MYRVPVKQLELSDLLWGQSVSVGLFLQQQLHHSVLLIKQLPDLVVVLTQAALQANPPGLRLDKGAQACKGVTEVLIKHPVQQGFTLKGSKNQN